MLQKKIVKIVIGAVIGGILGYGYYYFIGCSGGQCAITSNPWNSTLYGLVSGFFVALV